MLFFYTHDTVFVEDYLLPWIRRCKLLSDFIQGLSPNLALRMALDSALGYTNCWNGPGTANPYSKEYVEDVVKNVKGLDGKPYDLIVTSDFRAGKNYQVKSQ